MLATLSEELAERRRRSRWTQTDELLATVYDALQVIHRDLLGLGGTKRHQMPRFEPFPRPDDRHEPPAVSFGELAQMMLRGR